jgi:hypothetical protein
MTKPTTITEAWQHYLTVVMRPPVSLTKAELGGYELAFSAGARAMLTMMDDLRQETAAGLDENVGMARVGGWLDEIEAISKKVLENVMAEASRLGIKPS